MRFKTDGEEGAIRALNQVDAGINKVDNSAKSAKGGLGGMFSIAGGFAGGQAITALASSVFDIGKGFIFANANAEQAKMSLEVVMGSADAANTKFKEIQAFAASTPFSFPELVQSTINLEAFGLKSEDWMTTIGDTAAGLSKSVDQVTQAVLDAQGGQFERLTELGIKASVEGDKIVFKYAKDGQQMVATADKNNQAMIDSTIKGIWNDSYAGAMEKQSKTFTGQWSTLKDNINMTMMQMTGGIFEFAKSGIGILNSVFTNGFFDTFDGILGPSVTGFLKNLVDLGDGIIDAFGSGKGVKELVESLPASWQPAAEAILKVSDSVGDLWKSISQGDFDQFFKDLGEELGNIAEAGIELGEIIVKGTFKLVSNTAVNLYEWIKGQLFGTAAGDGTGGPSPSGSMSDISIGNVVVAGVLALGGQIAEWAGDIWGWVKSQLGVGGVVVGGDGTGGPDSDRTINLGSVLLDAAFGLAESVDWGGIGDAVVDGITKLETLAGDIGGAIVDKFTDIEWSTLVTADSFNLGVDVGVAIRGAIGTSADVVSGIANGFMDAIADLKWADVKDAMVTALGVAIAIPGAFLGLVTAITSALTGVIAGIVFGDSDDSFDSVITKISTGIQEAATVDNFIAAGKAIANAIWDAAKSIIDGWSLSDFLPSFAGGSSGPAKEVYNFDRPGFQFNGTDETGAVGSGGYADMKLPDNEYVINVKVDTGDAPQKLANFSSGALADIGKVKTDMPQFSGIAKQAFGDTGQAANNSSNVTANALRNMAMAGMQTASTMRSVAAQIVGAFQSLPGQLAGLAYNAVNSFAAALWSGVPAIYAAATAIANAVDIAVRARLLIASPSALMDEHGKNTVNPFLGHLRRGASEASVLMAGMVAPRLSAGGVYGSASGSGGGGNVYYVFESGSFIGRGAQSEIERMVAEGSAKRVNKGVSRGRLESSY